MIELLMLACGVLGQWASDSGIQDGDTWDAKRNSWSKQKMVYCDSTIQPMQRCKDLTPCSPRYLDCSKGPNRCICEVINPVSAAQTDLTMLERISAMPVLSLFVALATDPRYAEFMSSISKSGPMTLFVPVNEAFQKINTDDVNVMKSILKAHLVPGDALFTSNLFPLQLVTNAAGRNLRVSKEQSAWEVDNAKVVLPDLRVSNGVVWVIDQVLVPTPFLPVQGSGQVQQETLLEKKDQASFSELNKGFFRDTLGDVDFKQPFQGMRNGGQNVGQVQNMGQGMNGQPSDFIGQNVGPIQGQVVKTIADRIMANPQLTTVGFLLNDPRYSEIMQLLSGPGPVTAFIPTNEAFSKFSVDTSNVPIVRNLLKYHIVPNVAMTTSDFTTFLKLRTAHGASLKFSQANDGMWMVNNAKIVVPDIKVKNGVIFLIDQVLNPETQTGETIRNQGVMGQGLWHGAGLYCARSDLYYCNEKAECVLQESCENGCVQADAGFPDYCAVSGSGNLPSAPAPFQGLRLPPFQPRAGANGQ